MRRSPSVLSLKFAKEPYAGLSLRGLTKEGRGNLGCAPLSPPDCFIAMGAPVGQQRTRVCAAARNLLDEAQQEALAVHYAQIDPVRLLAKINQALEQLWPLAIYPDHQEALVTPPTEATIALR